MCNFPGTQPQIRELEEQFLKEIFTSSFQLRDIAAEDKENDAQENDKAITSAKQGEAAKRAPQDKVIAPAKESTTGQGSCTSKESTMHRTRWLHQHSRTRWLHQHSRIR